MPVDRVCGVCGPPKGATLPLTQAAPGLHLLPFGGLMMKGGCMGSCGTPAMGAGCMGSRTKAYLPCAVLSPMRGPAGGLSDPGRFLHSGDPFYGVSKLSKPSPTSAARYALDEVAGTHEAGDH